MARVVYHDENFQNFYVDINDQQPEITIGRNNGNMVMIPAKSLSRYHAKIIYQNRHYFLIDLKSSNGSYVNNQRVSQQEIHPGDKLRFGDICVDFVDDGRGSLAPAGSGMISFAQSSSSVGGAMNMPPGTPGMPPQRPAAQPPQMPPSSGMSGSSRPAVPAGAKLSAPKLQMFNPNLSNSSVGPDLRSVSMRPISSGGTYRPTMPNQPTFDEDMAKVAMEQMAAQVSEQPQSPVASTMTNGLDPAAAPRLFNPSSMGLRPPVPQRSTSTPPARAPMPAGVDPAQAPSSFNPSVMGPPKQPNAVRLSEMTAPAGLNGMVNAAAAPIGFNPNSMGPAAGMPIAPTPMQTAARPSGYNNCVSVVSAPTRPSGAPDLMPGISPLSEPASVPSGMMSDRPAPPLPESVVPESAELVSPAPQNVSSEHDSSGISCSDKNESSQNMDSLDAQDDNQHVKLEEISPAADRRTPVSSRERASSDGFSSLAGNARRAVRPGPHGRGDASASQQAASVPVASGYNRAVSGRGMPGTGRGRYAPRQDVVDTGTAKQASSGSTPIVQRGSSSAVSAVESVPSDEQHVVQDEKLASDDLMAKENSAEVLNLNSTAMEESAAVDDAVQKSDDVSELDDEHGQVDALKAETDNAAEHDWNKLSENGAGKSEIIELPDVESFEDVSNEPVLAPIADVSQVSSDELDKLRAELDEVREQLKESEQTVEILNGAMAELKEYHAGEIAKIKQQHEEELGQLKESHLNELAEQREEIETNYEQANIEMNSLQIENECIASELDQLKKKLADINKAGDVAMKFIPKWSSRFEALVQYARAMERAVDKLKLDVVEPKTFEYVRSMSDMIRFCADDLKNLEK